MTEIIKDKKFYDKKIKNLERHINEGIKMGFDVDKSLAELKELKKEALESLKTLTLKSKNSYDIEEDEKVAFMRARRNLMQKRFDMLLEKKAMAGELDFIENSPMLKEANDLYIAKMKRRKEKKFTHFFITINPDEKKVKLDQFMKMVKTFFSRKFLADKEYYYCFEQTGIDINDEETVGKHPHVHAIIEKGDIKYSDMVRNLNNSFKHIIGKGKIQDLLNVKKRGAGEFRNTLRYILGYKDGEPDDLITTDAYWRIENDIEDIYFNDSVPCEHDLTTKASTLDEGSEDKGKEVSEDFEGEFLSPEFETEEDGDMPEEL